MSDTVDMFRDLKELRQLERQRLGVKCPKCISEQPRRQPTILLPGRVCKLHKPWYSDPRPKPTDAEWNAAMEGTGWTQGANPPVQKATEPHSITFHPDGSMTDTRTGHYDRAPFGRNFFWGKRA